MKIQIKTISLLLLLMSFISAKSNNGWETHTSKDGKTTVKSRIIEQEEFMQVDYSVVTTGNFTLDQADQFFSNSNNHKKFWENCEKSESFKKVSENEWYTYLYFNYTWPLSDADCAQHYKRVKTDDALLFEGKATPEAIEDKGVNRTPLFDAKITVSPISDSQSKISLEVSFGSTMKAPKWMLSSWLPDGPMEIMERIIENLE